MTSTPASSATVDLIDTIVPLTPAQRTWETRRQRPKVVAATQGSCEAMFSPTVAGISVAERLLVALHVCRVSKADALAGHYRDSLLAQGADDHLVDAVDSSRAASLTDLRLRTLLDFAAKLTERPVEGDRAAVQALVACGLTTPAIVALGQLVAFLSYQIRLASGLRAMAAAEAAP